MLSTVKSYGSIILICLGAALVIISYSSGYSDGKLKLQKELEAANSKAEMLQSQVDNKEEKIVTEYVYKDRVIVKKEQVLIGKVDNELKQESAECRIGPAFIRLHNAATDSSN